MDFKEKIQKFLKENINSISKWKNKKLIVIYGPTASWKTQMSIDIAKYIDSEIISTDSRQIFVGLDIWTWKITDSEKQWITHHMIDIITPDNTYSVWEFKKLAEKKMEEIYLKWKIPILCWGTWLYIDTLIYDLNIPKIPADKYIRETLENEAKEYWNEYLYNKLLKLDPLYAKELHFNNIRYIIRALEIKILTWKSKMDFREDKKLKYDTLFLSPYDWNREKLYENIDFRVKQMFEKWFINEVDNLLKIYNKNDFWLQTIWYKEVINYLLNLWNDYILDKKLSLWEKEKLNIKLSLDETIELVQKNNRNYAKKQLTWFKKYAK